MYPTSISPAHIDTGVIDAISRECEVPFVSLPPTADIQAWLREEEECSVVHMVCGDQAPRESRFVGPDHSMRVGL